MRKTLFYENLLKYLVLAVALSYVMIYLAIAVGRVQYPFALEWMEGGSLEHVQRILDGEKLYVRPSLEFVPYIYPPLYFYVSAGAALLLHRGFPVLRLVSGLSSLGCFLMMFIIVKQETRESFSALIAMSLFAATFSLSGAWFDIGRVDALFLLLILIGVYFLRYKHTRMGMMLAGIFLALAFFTKQTALVIAFPLMIYTLYKERWRSIWSIGIFFLFVGGGTGMLNYLHEGWYWYYIFELPRSHELIPSMFLLFWTREILLPLAIAICCGLFYLGEQWQQDRHNSLFYIAIITGMVGGAWMSRLHTGGHQNVLLPAYAAFSLLFGLSVHRIKTFIGLKLRDSQRLFMYLLYSGCVIQFAVLVYNPVDFIPTRQDEDAGYHLLNLLEEIPGDIYIPRHGYLAGLIGKKSFAQEMALHDILRSQGMGPKALQIKTALNEEIQKAISAQRFDAIVLDYQDNEQFVMHYHHDRRIFEDDSVFWPVSGVKTRPEFIYTP